MRRHTAIRRDSLIVIGAALLFGVGMPVFLFSRGIFSDASSSIVLTDIQPVAVSVPFTKLTQGTQSVVAKRVNYVLTSPTELEELWKVVDAPGKPPRVDFRKNAVIAVFAGPEPGSSIAVAKIEDSNMRLVSIALAKPDGDCEHIQSTESSYEIIAVPATPLPLTHEDIVQESDCSE